MADFRRPPEWQQPVDRHSALVDPVLTVRQLSRFEFSRKSLTRIDHALVFTSPKGAYDTFLPPLRPSRSEVAAKRYTAVYEVDMGVHPYGTELALPSDNDAFEFAAAVDLSWQVADPAQFVRSGHRDVPALLVGELQQAARPVTRGFAIGQSARAEEAMLRAIAAMGPLGAMAGLQVNCVVRLRRDQENIDHQRRLQAIDHSSAEEIRVAQRGTEYDVEFDRRARQQDELQLGRAMDYGRQQQELALQQQRWAHEQAVLQSRQEIELQKLEAEKVDFYLWHLQQGGVHQWALHLAQHPEDSALVMNTMREDQLRLIQSQMDLVRQLLSGDNAENYELEGPKQLALRTMSDILNQRLPGVAQGPPPQLPAHPEGEAGGGTAAGPAVASWTQPVVPQVPQVPQVSQVPPVPPGQAPIGGAQAQGAQAQTPQGQSPFGQIPGQVLGQATQSPLPQSPSPERAYAPGPVPTAPGVGTIPGWQPPPGYGSSPTPTPPPAPPAPEAAPPTGTEDAGNGRGDGQEVQGGAPA
ncbi:hypothetical protein [Streptomyces jumonjinensis]|uniref:hypothetical protein n=1 Tax=Streptomyces jumonjinensis TaxID=1945 RepID=UPI003796842D